MIELPIDWQDPAAAILVLLFCGHLFADFLFQTSRLVDAKKNSIAGVAAHTFYVGLVQGVVVLPFSWSGRSLLLVLGIAAAHFVIDALKVRLGRSHPRHVLPWFFLDQGLHAGAILLAWSLWPLHRVDPPSAPLGTTALLLAVLAFNANGGSAIVTAALTGLSSPPEGDEGPKGAGHRIGVLERWMILGLVWMGQWGAVGLVLTAKSIARFKRMEEQAFAEIYLVGTMTSVIVAMVSGMALQALLPS